MSIQRQFNEERKTKSFGLFFNIYHEHVAHNDHEIKIFPLFELLDLITLSNEKIIRNEWTSTAYFLEVITIEMISWILKYIYSDVSFHHILRHLETGNCILIYFQVFLNPENFKVLVKGLHWQNKIALDHTGVTTGHLTEHLRRREPLNAKLILLPQIEYPV